MDALLFFVVALLMLGGLLGSALPAIPGTPLILAGAFLYSFVTDFDPVGPWRLAALVALGLFGYGLDYLAGAFGTRKFGGSRWAMLGAVLGAIIGLFFGLVGVLLGPIVGAVGLELLYRRELVPGLKSGLGTAVGMLVGLVAKLSLAVTMVGLFTFWAIRG